MCVCGVTAPTQGDLALGDVAVTLTELLPRVRGTHTGTEVGADLAQTHGGVAADGALLVLGLQPRKVLHQLHVEVGLVQFWGQKQHGLQGGRPESVGRSGQGATHGRGLLGGHQ